MLDNEERIVISDDELSIILEEPEGGEEVTIDDHNNTESPVELRESPDGGESSVSGPISDEDVTTNALRTNTFNPESRSTLLDISSDIKFQSDTQPGSLDRTSAKENRPETLPVSGQQSSHPLLINDHKGSQETLAQVTELTENSPSINSALNEFVQSEFAPSGQVSGDIGLRINESIKLLEPESKVIVSKRIDNVNRPLELNSTITKRTNQNNVSSSNSPDSMDQGITEKNLSDELSLSRDSMELDNGNLQNDRNDILRNIRNGILRNATVSSQNNVFNKNTFTLSPQDSDSLISDCLLYTSPSPRDS